MSEITLNSLPKTLDELKAMPQAALTVPEEVAALTVAALALYPENPAETEKMLDFLRGPRPFERHRQTVYPRPFSRQGIPDAFLPCRFHTGKQLHTCAAVPSHRFGKQLQPDAVCRRVPDLICGLQRR